MIFYCECKVYLFNGLYIVMVFFVLLVELEIVEEVMKDFLFFVYVDQLFDLELIFMFFLFKDELVIYVD